jgi:aerobic-type carbon monoxide dehydrogenase small subunit (CoxS/CutS family)
MDGAATRSCSIPAAAAAGTKITTVEGLEQNGRLSAVQQAFLDEGAFQCGYCTSGMIMSVTALLQDNHAPKDEEIEGAMNGNVCRCGTYPRILEAIKRASSIMAGGGAR